MTPKRSFLVGSLALAQALALSVAGCGNSTPTDVSGNYTVNIISGDNSCMLANWTQGGVTSGVVVEIAQSGAVATATVKGVAGGLFALWLGSAQFQGMVTGDDILLDDFGTVSQTSGNCSWTTQATISGTLKDDTLTGTVVYRLKTNGSPECAFRTTCTSSQTFNGLRPPK